jgi:tetratricopeptide (TPR) repeat protein
LGTERPTSSNLTFQELVLKPRQDADLVAKLPVNLGVSIMSLIYRKGRGQTAKGRRRLLFALLEIDPKGAHQNSVGRVTGERVMGKWVMGEAIASACLFALLTSLPAHAQTSTLNQQLTIHLNSGSRSPERDRADALVGEGKTLAAEGNASGATAAWRQALQLYQAAGDLEAMGTVYGYLAAAYKQPGQVAVKEDALRRQLAIARDQRDFATQITANNRLGRVLAPRQGGTPPASELFSEGMTVASSIRTPKGEYLTAQNINWLANSLNQPDAFTRQYEFNALKPTQWAANPLSYATKLNAQGDRKLLEQRYYASTRLNATADRLSDQAGDVSMQFQTLDSLVVAYRAMGRYDLASSSLDQRLQIANAIGSPHESLATLVTLGELNSAIGRVATAQQYYEQALVLAQQLNDAQQSATLKERLAGYQP